VVAGSGVSLRSEPKEALRNMLHVGLDLSRRRLDYCLLDGEGVAVETGAVAPDADALGGLVGVIELRHGPRPVRAVIESMNGARFVHDVLERRGWEVLVADAQRVKGLAPLACKTDRIDAWVLAELSRRELVPAIWLPSFAVRQERERARWRLHLVKHRSSLKQRVHAQLMAFGHACPVSDLFGHHGRELLERLEFPEPWRGDVLCAVALIDELDRQITAIESELKALGADHPYVPLLLTVPGVGWVLGYTIASEIGDIERFASPRKLCGYSGLCPRVYQSGDTDRRGPLAKHGPKYLRWALIEAATNAAKHPLYRDRYQHTKQRVGRQRGAKVAQIQLARTLTEAIWHMLTRDQKFAPAGAPFPLAA
jgi:transposase